jgi:tubulin--tyrosine ligase
VSKDIDMERSCNECIPPADALEERILSAPRPAISEGPGYTKSSTALLPDVSKPAVRKVRKVAAYSFYAVNYGQEDNKLGQVYSALAQFLHKRREDWRPCKDARQCNLVLAEAQAAGVQWAKLGMFRVKPLVNFYRGFQALCRKTMMWQTLCTYATLTGTTRFLEGFVPQTFVFTKKCQERAEFIKEYRQRHEDGRENTWILKPSGGAHGDDIVIMNKEEDITKFLDSQSSEAGSTPWVVQKYLEKPLLLQGGRKFDMRCMVLVTHDFNIYLYTEGILRSCSVPFSLNDLSDRFAHLANHCLQEHHPDYGKHEPLNLLSYADFDKFLLDSGQPATLQTHILPQIEKQIVYSLLAARDQLVVQENADYKCFNLLGYDFMLDDQCSVYLVEVNSSPTTDPRLIAQLVE